MEILITLSTPVVFRLLRQYRRIHHSKMCPLKLHKKKPHYNYLLYKLINILFRPFTIHQSN